MGIPRKLILAITSAILLSACAGANAPRDSSAAWSPARHQAALAEARLLPDPGAFATRQFAWFDASRQREVKAKLYLPANPNPEMPAPLIIFSHGLGGSREGYSYLGSNWAARGYASLHIQHVGSDNQLWRGNPLNLVSRLQSAANEAEAIARVQDLRFALDSIFAEAGSRLDPRRIVAAGHSYGANTALLAAGAVFERVQGRQSYGEPRLSGAVLISAPPFHGEIDAEAVVRPIAIPTLHITATGDEIRLPGYLSSHEDRVRVFSAIGSARKALVVFRDGAHSMFTDRLAPGGQELNVQVKAATRDLTLAFLDEVLGGQTGAFGERSEQYQAVIAKLESGLDNGR
jgi:dienelactone hydrolase